jgi:hypothetical protein
MSETVWVARLTGAFTLASGVVGVVLTHRYSRTQAAAARREDRRRDARALLAQFVEAGTQWADANWNMVPFFQKNAKDRTFWLEWPDTDSGKTIREHSLAITRTGGELRLIVGDEELLAWIAEATAKMSESEPMLALIDDGKRIQAGKNPGDALGDAWAHYLQVREAFQAVEGRAADLLRGAL